MSDQDTIRPATVDDLARIVELGLRFWQEGPYHDQPVNRPASAQFAMNLISSTNGKILVGEKDGTIVGVIAFVVTPHFFTGVLTATELIWYVEPEHRPGGIAMKIKWAAEKEAFYMGAGKMQFTGPLEEDGSVPTGNIYKRYGYKPMEVGYEKELGLCHS